MELLAQDRAKIKSSDVPFSYQKFQVTPVNSHSIPRSQSSLLSLRTLRKRRGDDSIQ